MLDNKVKIIWKNRICHPIINLSISGVIKLEKYNATKAPISKNGPKGIIPFLFFLIENTENIRPINDPKNNVTKLLIRPSPRAITPINLISPSPRDSFLNVMFPHILIKYIIPNIITAAIIL